MTVSVRSASAASGQTSTPVNPAKPAGTTAGDLLVAIHVQDSDGSLTSMGAPTGWTEVGSNARTGVCFVKVWTKIAGGSEPSSYAFTDSSASDSDIGILAITGHDATTPLAVSPTFNGSGTNTTAHTAPAVTGVANGLLITGHCVGASTNSTRTYTPPSGMTEYVDTNAGGWTAIEVNTLGLAVSGDTGSKIATCSASTKYTAVSLVVAPATGGGGGGGGSFTGGSGGSLTDRTNVAYTNPGGTAGAGHIYAGGLDWSKSVGLLVYTDGSGDYGLVNTSSTYLLAGPTGLIAVAKAHALVLVALRAPGDGCTDGDGVCWYLPSYDGTTRAAKTKWADDFIQTQVLSQYNIDLTRVVIAGYSSGAQFTMEYYGPQYASAWMQDGLLLGISYGGSPKVTANYPTAFKQTVAASWDVGADDPYGYQGDPTYDAQSGYDWYTANGFTATELTVVPGVTHDRTGQFGGIVDREVTQYVAAAVSGGIVAFRAAAEDARGTTNAPIVALPTGTAPGDLLLAFHVSDYRGTLAAMTAPAGWVEVANNTTRSGDVGFVKIWQKTATGSEPADYTFNDSTSATSDALIVALTGWDSTDAFATAPTWNSGTSQTTHVAPGATGVSGGVLLTAHIAGTAGTTRTYSSGPSGMTLAQDVYLSSSGYVTENVYYLALTAAGPTGSKIATLSASAPFVAVSLVVQPPTGKTAFPVGITSAEAFGIPFIGGDQTVTPVGITSAEAFGSPTLTIATGTSQTARRMQIGDVPTLRGVNWYGMEDGLRGPTLAELQDFRARGYNMVRLPVAYGTTNAAIAAVLADADTAHIWIGVDVHNFGRIGGTANINATDGTVIDSSNQSTWWAKCTDQLAAFSSYISYVPLDMNEPKQNGGDWEPISQGRVTALRSAGWTGVIGVSAAKVSSAGGINNGDAHPGGWWVADSNAFLEVHQYLQPLSDATLQTRAVLDAWVVSSSGQGDLTTYVQYIARAFYWGAFGDSRWATVPMLIGEFAMPPGCETELDTFLAQVDSRRVGAIEWAGGMWGTYNWKMTTAQYDVLSSHLVAITPLIALVDAFASLDTNTWTTSGTPTPSVSAGQLSLTVSSSYPTITSAAYYSLISSQYWVEIPQVSNVGAATAQVFTMLTTSATSKTGLEFVLDAATTLRARRWVSNTATELTNTTYSATNHRWWRIIEAAGTVSWQTAPDGATWTTLTSATTSSLSGLGIDLSRVKVSLGAGYYGTEGSPGTALLDNFNVGAIAAQTVTITAGIGSAEAFGSPVVTVDLADQTVSAIAITSSEAFGSPTITVASADQTVNAITIASSEAFGFPTITVPPAIESGAYPGATLWPGSTTYPGAAGGFGVSGFGSAPFGGTSIPTGQMILPAGIAGGETIGVPVVAVADGDQPVNVTAIDSAEVFGVPIVAAADPEFTISPVGIPSAEAFGDPGRMYVFAEVAPPVPTGADTYFVDGVDLSGYAWRIETAEGLQNTPGVIGEDVVLPGRDGALEVFGGFGQQRRPDGIGTIVFSLWLKGVSATTGLIPGGSTTGAEYFARWDELVRLFHRRRVTIDHVTADGSTRRAIAHLVPGDSIGPARVPSSPFFGRLKAAFAIPAAHWTDTTTVTTGQQSLTTGGSLSLAAFAGATAVCTELTVIFGAGNNPRLSTAWGHVGWNNVISAGRQLGIDTTTGTTNSAGGTSWTPGYDALTFAPGPRLFEIDPSEALTATLTHTGGGSMTVEVTGKRRYRTS